MIKIRIHNAKWMQQLIIGPAAAFFAAKLGIRKGTVLIECVSGLRRTDKCRGMAHKRPGTHRYHIKLERSLGPRALVSCLAHEMIHIHQWVSGKMEDIDGERWRVRWGKRTYYSSMAYTRHPWEIEAYRYAPLLVKSWNELFKIKRHVDK